MSDLPTGWTSATFGDVVTRMSNGMPGMQNKDGNGVPVSRIETIADQRIDFGRIGYVAEFDTSHLEKYKLLDGDVLFSHINSPTHLGKTAIFSGGNVLYHGINLLRIQVNRELITPAIFDFACKFLRYKGEFSLRAQHAVNQSSLNQSKLAAFPISLPPLAEQKRIADKLDTVLTRVDAVNTRLARVAPLLKRFRQSVLAAATAGRLTQDWRTNHLNAAPLTAMLLVNVCEKITDGEHISPAKTQHGVPLLSAKNVAKDGLSFDDTHFVSEEDAKVFWLRCRPELGDILVCSRGTIGRSVLVETNRPFCLMGTVILLKPKASLVHSKFFSLAIAAPKTQKIMQGASGATAVSALYLKDIKRLEIDVPGLDEQTEIVRRVETLFAFADRLEARLAPARVKLLVASVMRPMAAYLRGARPQRRPSRVPG